MRERRCSGIESRKLDQLAEKAAEMFFERSVESPLARIRYQALVAM